MWIALFVSVLTLAVMEAVWLSSTQSFYSARLSSVSADGTLRLRSLPAAVLVYALLLAGVWVLVLRPASGNALRAAGRGAVFGATVYGVYNLTNMATLPGYRWSMVAVDTMWGATLFGVVSYVFSVTRLVRVK
jgi:uncharacterized membrane protein